LRVQPERCFRHEDTVAKGRPFRINIADLLTPERGGAAGPSFSRRLDLPPLF